MSPARTAGETSRAAVHASTSATDAVCRPFSNLDTDTRGQLAAELRGLLKATGATVLMVTHDQGEAFAMADHIGVMEQGRILQWGGPEALYRMPRDRFVAGFIGRGTLVPAAALGLARAGEVLLRPHALRLDPQGDVHAELLALSFRGPGHVASLRLEGGAVVDVDLDDPAALAGVDAGAPVRLRLADDALVAFE